MSPVACLSIMMEPCIFSGSGASGGPLNTHVAQQAEQSRQQVLWIICLCIRMTMSGAVGQCFRC